MKALILMLIFQCYSKRSNQPKWDMPDGSHCAENEEIGFNDNVDCCDVGEELLQMADKDGNIVSENDGKTIQILAPNVCLSSGMFGYKGMIMQTCVCSKGFVSKIVITLLNQERPDFQRLMVCRKTNQMF